MQLLSARKIAKVGTASFFLSQTNVNTLVSRTWTTPLVANHSKYSKSAYPLIRKYIYGKVFKICNLYVCAKYVNCTEYATAVHSCQFADLTAHPLVFSSPLIADYQRVEPTNGPPT